MNKAVLFFVTVFSIGGCATTEMRVAFSKGLTPLSGGTVRPDSEKPLTSQLEERALGLVRVVDKYSVAKVMLVFYRAEMISTSQLADSLEDQGLRPAVLEEVLTYLDNPAWNHEMVFANLENGDFILIPGSDVASTIFDDGCEGDEVFMLSRKDLVAGNICFNAEQGITGLVAAVYPM